MATEPNGARAPDQRSEPTTIAMLPRDLRAAAATLTVDEARYLVDTYYQLQDFRKATGNQRRSLVEAEEPHATVGFFYDQFETLEKQIRGALDVYSREKPLAQWARGQVGIGPVIAAGLLAHIDMHRAPTVGHIWRYAGLDPTMKWLGNQGARRLLGHVSGSEPAEEYDGVDLGDLSVLSEAEAAAISELLVEDKRGQLSREQLVMISRLTGRKLGNLIRAGRDDQDRITRASMLKLLARRPWNASLKVLCWKIGDSFVKNQNRENCFYGQIYAERKQFELARDAAGGHAEQARATLEEKRIRDTETRKVYEAGRLPAGRLDLRARRYATKLFLAHYHEQGCRLVLGIEPPLPYPIAHLGHVHRIEAPNG